MRPLYITSGQGTRIRLQGPALRVETAQRAPAVMALRHLSQVVCPTTTRWSSRALSACMTGGVPVVFTDTHGQVIGFLHGLGAPQRGNLFARLVELLGQRQGFRIFDTWLKAMESRQRCRLCRQLRIPADRHRCRTLKRLCQRERARRAEPELVQLLESSWRQALAGLVARYLAQVGMSAQHQRALWPQVDLATELARYLEWELLLPSLEALNCLQQATRDGRTPPMLQAYALARFGCLQARLEDRAGEFLHRLDLRLLEEAVI